MKVAAGPMPAGGSFVLSGGSQRMDVKGPSMKRTLWAIIALLPLLAACQPETASSPSFDPGHGLISDVDLQGTPADSAEDSPGTAPDLTPTVSATATPENYCASSMVGLSYDCPPDDWEVVEEDTIGGRVVMRLESDERLSFVALERQLDFDFAEWERFLGYGSQIGGLNTLEYNEENAWHGYIVIDDQTAIQFDGLWEHPENELVVREIIKSVELIQQVDS
jgi:hypothetical protein